MNKYCETYITIEKEALIHNAEYFKRISSKKLIAVIKSNAYGHGLLQVAHILKESADIFAVASLDSALAIRNDGINLPILILNPLNIECVKLAVNNNMMITVSSLEYLKEVERFCKDTDKKILVHIKIDSGMNRMGLKTKEEYKALLDYIDNSNIFKAVGVYTHFHTPNNKELSEKQLHEFYEIFNHVKYDFQYIHLCSTSATLNKLDILESTHVRIGLGLYGLCEDENVREALSLYSKIEIIKEVNEGETVGYNAKFKADEKTYIGVLPLGYSDGIIRANTGRNVYIDGNYCEIIGNVCMNSLMVKLPYKEIKKEVELIGPHVRAIDIAKYLNTISYEVVTYLPSHIRKIVI